MIEVEVKAKINDISRCISTFLDKGKKNIKYNNIQIKTIYLKNLIEAAPSLSG